MKIPDRFDLDGPKANELSGGESVHLRVEPEFCESKNKFVREGEKLDCRLQSGVPTAGSLEQPSVTTPEAVPSDDTCLPLDLSFLWAYWALVIMGVCLCGAALLWWCSHISAANTPFFVPALVGGCPGLVSFAYRHICWRKSVAAAIKAGGYRWADVTIIRQPESFERGFHLHVLIDDTLLVPVSEADNQFDQKLFSEIVREPVAKRKIFFVPESDVPVAVAIGNFYLLLARSRQSFWSSYGIQLILFMLGVQILFFWKLGRAFQPGFF